MKHRKRKLLSILLAASLVFQSAGITTQAANNDVSDDIVDIIEVDDLSDIPLLTDYSLDDPMSDDADISSEINNDISETEIVEEISTETSEPIEDDSAENVVVDSDESINEVLDEISEETPDTEDSSVDAPPAEDVSDGDLFPGLPAEYKLSDEQMAQKKVLSEHVSDIAPYEAKDNSSLYAEGELVYLTDSAEEAQMVADAFGGELESYYLGVAVIVIPENRTVTQAIMAAADPDFNLPAVWPNYYKQIYASHNDPALSEAAEDYQWQHSFVGDSYAWDAGYKGQGVKVAVLDTGLLYSHEEFTGRVAKQLSMLEDTATTSTTDTQGHGTHVAGIIAANLDNGKGGAGIAPESSLYIYGIGNSDGSISSAAEYRAINQAINDKVDIINMSLGSGYFDANENASVQKAYNAGIAVFAAAGNESTTGTSYPASFDHVCSVASLQQDGRKSYFTNYNSSVDLAFPGSDIYSTAYDGSGSYTYKSGTSMATPVAAGVAAVILSGSDQVAELKGKTGTARVDALYKVMSSNAVKSPSSGTGSGTTYLPKVFKINTSAGSDVPAVPTFFIGNKTTNKAAFNTAGELLEIKGGSADIEIWFNTEGKTPSYKNGTVTNGTKYEVPIAIEGKKVTVKAIAVNKASGKASKAASATYTFAPDPTGVEIRADGVHKLSAGSKLSLKAVVTPSYAVSTKVKWEVSPFGGSPAGGVSINASGKLSVDKNATGVYTVKATAVDKKGNAYANNISSIYNIEIIAPESAVKSIALGEKSKTIEIGSAVAFDAAKDIKVTYANGKAGSAADVVWSSSNTDIAVVTTDGKVVGRTPGKVNIKATANDGSGKSATCKIVVNQPAKSIQISGCEKLAAGKSVTLKASIAPENVSVKTLDWKVEGGSGITVKNGKVSASKTASGTCTVTATTKGDNPVSDSITITIVKEPIKSIKMDKSITLFSTPGNFASPTSKALATTIEGGDSTAIRYESSAPGIVSVNNAGVVSAVSSGKAKITCMATDGSNKKAVCTVTVSAPMSRLTIVAPDDNAGCVSVGSTLKLTAKAGTSFGVPQNTKVNWSVVEGSEKLISVSSSGAVKALSVGDAKVGTYAYVKAEAADGSGASDVYKVAVYRKIKSVQIAVASNAFVPMITLDNGTLCSVPFSTSFSSPKNNKIGYQTASYMGYDAFELVPEKATTQKSSLSQLYTTDAIKVSVKIKLHPNGKSVSKSAYVLRTTDGYVINTDKTY